MVPVYFGSAGSLCQIKIASSVNLLASTKKHWSEAAQYKIIRYETVLDGLTFGGSGRAYCRKDTTSGTLKFYKNMDQTNEVTVSNPCQAVNSFTSAEVDLEFTSSDADEMLVPVTRYAFTLLACEEANETIVYQSEWINERSTDSGLLSIMIPFDFLFEQKTYGIIFQYETEVGQKTTLPTVYFRSSGFTRNQNMKITLNPHNNLSTLSASFKNTSSSKLTNTNVKVYYKNHKGEIVFIDDERSFELDSNKSISLDDLDTGATERTHGGLSFPYYVVWTNSAGNQGAYVETTLTFMLEDIILTDETTSYKIRYNPQVANLKYTIADVITSTLGGKYPFTTRNGHQNYRTFTLGGMISCADDTEIYTLEPHKNWIQQERAYRDRFLAFLHNDKVKLFQSGPEGCMLIKLSNISLTSESKLGRNIYSFSATATEVDDLANIDNYNIP